MPPRYARAWFISSNSSSSVPEQLVPCSKFVGLSVVGSKPVTCIWVKGAVGLHHTHQQLQKHTTLDSSSNSGSSNA